MSPVEATYAQHSVWFTEQAGAAGGAYQMALGIRFGGDLDVAALRQACGAVLARHPALGAAFDVAGGAPRLVRAEEPVPVAAYPLTEERVRQEIARKFQLRCGPLARFALLGAPPEASMLLLTAHHLVFDGMSKDVVVADLAAAYNAAVTGRPVTLDPLAELDAGTIADERARVAMALPEARAYWGSRWPAPTELVLPGLRRARIGAEPGATVEFALEPALEAATTALGVTRFELLLSIVYALLHRYGNATEPVTIGLSTRTPRTAGHVGLFVNELPLCAPPPGGTFREHAGAVRGALRELYRLRPVPLSHAVNGLRPAAALTPVSVGYRRRAAEPRFAGVDSAVEWQLFNGVARNTLHVQIVDSPTGVAVSLQHNPAALPTDAVRRIGEHFRTILDAVLDDPDRPVDDLPLLPAAERHLVVEAWQGPRRAAPGTVPELFAIQAHEHPDAVAVVDSGRSMTYADVDAESAALAAALRERGIGPGARVAVSLPRSARAVVALLAVMRAGAAYVPVDPAYPPARRDLVLDDAAPALVLDGSFDPHREGPRTTTPRPDDAAGQARQSGTAGAGRSGVCGGQARQSGTAYVMYTSGSTGRPKGVSVPHGALTNLLLAMRDTLGARPHDRWLGLTSLGFDISGLELFLPLVTGARVVIAPDGAALDGAALTRLIRDEGVTHVQATPSGWRILLDGGFDGTSPPVVALTGGEALPDGLAGELRARSARLFNVYGPTETTIWSTAAELSTMDESVTIGRPIANTRAYVLDADLRPVPIGLPGELYLGGDGLADGYLGRPGHTADRFVPDPFGPAGARLYRTGDLARWLPDGRIAYGGRVDTQVKIRGHRVELGEIEARLLAHPGVAQGTVALRGERLVGYLVPRGVPPEPAALRQHLAATLPAAMLPEAWVVLDRLPLTPNGKLDRAALPEPPARALAGSAEPAAEEPSGDVVEQLQAIWRDVLDLDEIGLDEDLFDLGGHSLTITRISSRIHQRLGVELPLDVFFDTPTIAEIAVVVRDLAGERR